MMGLAGFSYAPLPLAVEVGFLDGRGEGVLSTEKLG